MSPRIGHSTNGDPLTTAKTDALRLLKFRPRSRRELSDRLAGRGYEEETIQAVLNELEKHRLINDAGFAKLWATNRLEQRGFGSRRVRQELRAKGLDDALIQTTLQEVAGNADENARASDVAQRYLRRLAGLETSARKRRLWGFLARRGFPSNVINRVINDTCKT